MAACCMMCLSAGLLAQTDDTDMVVDRIVAIAAEDNQTMKHLDVVTNRIGGRLLGSSAYEDALEWAASLFEKWGLEVYRDCAGTLPVGFNRGPWFGRMIGAGDNESLHFVTPSYTAGTKGLQRGTVVREPKTRAEFERMKGTIKGAWVLIGGKSRGWPIDYSPKGDSLRAEIIAKNEEIARQNNEIRTYNRNISKQRADLEQEIKDNPKKKAKNEAQLAKLQEKPLLPLIEEPALFYKEMKEAGMLGIIQAAPVPLCALYDRKNLDRMTWDDLPELPDIKLDEEQFEQIARKVDKREYIQLEFDIRNHFRMGPIEYHSLIAVMKGTEFPDEYIFCSGHLDAYDVATGGVDCGTGIAPALEAARLLSAAGARPKRSIVFALWAGEEFGLLGSRHWVEHNPDKLPGIVNFFNRDGGPTVANSLTVPEEWYEDLVPICNRLNDINPDFPFTLRIGNQFPMDIPVTAGGSDHAYFAMNGVPVISFGTGDPKGYNFDYSEIWHTERDLYNKSIPEYMEHTSVVNAIVFYGMANMEHRPDAGAVYKPKK